jgi:MFS family permease
MFFRRGIDGVTLMEVVAYARAVAGEGGIGLRSAAGGIGIGVAVGYNIANVGTVASTLAGAYGVALATIGLLTTFQFVVHMVMQIPGGRAVDRWGARRSGLVALVLIGAGNAVSLIAPLIGLAFLGRGIVGVGTGFGFVAGSDYIRARGGTPVMQGYYGAGSVLAPGVAIAVVPALADSVGFRAPYLSALVVAGVAAVLLVLAPPSHAAVRHAGEKIDRSLFRDRYLLRLSAIHAASFGFSVIVGNWVVTLLEHHGHSKRVAAAAGSLTLLLAAFSRIGGGALLRRRDASRWVALSIVLGGVGAIGLALPLSTPALFVAAADVGLMSGVAFAMAFTGAQLQRPDAPGMAIGFVNVAAALSIVVGTPLVGLTFSLPGDGRLGFVVLGVLAALAAVATPPWRWPKTR